MLILTILLFFFSFTHSLSAMLREDTQKIAEKSNTFAQHLRHLYRTEKYNAIIETYDKKYINFFAIGTSSPRIYPEKHAAKETMIDILSKMSFEGHQEAQLRLTTRLFERCIMSSTIPQNQKIIENSHTSCALQLFNFLLTLSNSNVPINTPETLKKKIINTINTSCPNISYVLQLCRYLQAENSSIAKAENTSIAKNAILNLLKNKNCDDFYIQETCQFLLNYTDPDLTINEAAKKFIHYIRNQQNPSEILSKIPQEPFYTSVINALEKASSIETNESHLTDLYIILAELYFYDNNWSKAHEYYSKNSQITLLNNKIHPDFFQHIFESYIANNQTYSLKNISYLCSFMENPHEQLPNTKQYNKDLSSTNADQIIGLINNGFEHLACLEQKKLNPNFVKNITNLKTKFHMLLSSAYNDNNDPIQSFNHVIQAMKYRNNQQDNELLKILAHQEQESTTDLYKFTHLINIILQFINKQPYREHNIPGAEFSEIVSFADSHLYCQLLPYCAPLMHAQKQTTKKPEIILLMISLYYKNQTNNKIAQYYIDQLHAARYEKAAHIFFNHPEEQNLIEEALLLLEKNINVNQTNPLVCMQQNNLNTELLKKTIHLKAELHMLLSKIYNKKNNSIASFNHLIQAMQYRNNQQDRELLKILAHHEQQLPTFFNQFSLINIILQFIHKQPYQKGKDPLTFANLLEYAQSNIGKKLIPYCASAISEYKPTNKIPKTISLLMALYYKHQKNYELAKDSIDQLKPPLFNKKLLLKTKIYNNLGTALPYTEIKHLIEKFIHDKQLFKKDFLTIALAALCSKHHFIDLKNYNTALKLITQFFGTKSIPSPIISLLVDIEQHLINTNDPYLALWQKELSLYTPYDMFEHASSYNTKTNIIIGHYLEQQTNLNYEKIIHHYEKAIQDITLSKEAITLLQEKLSNLYYQWSQSLKNDPSTSLLLLEKAISLSDNPQARYEKAAHIFFNNLNNQDLIKEALLLLEKNTTTENVKKDDSLILLAHYYLDFCFSNIIQTVPQSALDITKALTYLKQSTSLKAIEYLIALYTGAAIKLDDEISKKYIDLEQAIDYTTMLINQNYNMFNNIIRRHTLYTQNNDYQNALKDIETLLERKDPQLNTNIKTCLLHEKTTIIFEHLINNDDYQQALTSFKKLIKLYNQQNYPININDFRFALETVCYITENNIITDSAIELCAFVAGIEYLTGNSNISHSYRHNLLQYLATAANNYNIDAQLIIAPYWNGVGQEKDSTTNTNNFIAYLTHAHTALTHKNLLTKKRHLEPIIHYLNFLVHDGASPAHYILCDYYKNDQKKFNENLILFSQAPQQRYFHEATVIVQKACNSCIDTLNEYVDRYLENPETADVPDFIATLTLGAMFLYNDNINQLKQAITYFNALLFYPLPQTLNHLSFKRILASLRTNAYLNKALLEKNINHTFYLNSLIQSCYYGSLMAATLLAEEYINQCEQKKLEIIQTQHFLPVLNQNIHPENTDVNFLNLVAKVQASEKKLTLEKSEQSKLLREQTMNELIHQEPEPKDEDFNNQIKVLRENNKQKEINKLVLEYAGKNNPSSPTASIMLAHCYLTSTEYFKKNYNLSKQFLIQALDSGLYSLNPHSLKKFHNGQFLRFVCLYLTSVFYELASSTSTQNKKILASLSKIIADKVQEPALKTTFKKYYDMSALVPLYQTEWQIKE